MADAKPIAIYVRVSSKGQKYASQEGPILEFCKGRKWTASDFDVYREKVSGVSRTLPALDRIITGARAGKVKTVVVYKLDRLGRSLTKISWVVGELRRMGVDLICVTQGIDTSAKNPMAQVQIGMLGVFAEFERDMMAERTKAGYDAARARGIVVGRPRKRDEFKDRAVSMREAGKPLGEISRELGISVTTVSRLTAAPGAKKNVRGPDKRARKRRNIFPKSPPPNLPLFPGQE